MSDYYETPRVDDHDPLCPPYLGARGGRAECAICEALEKSRRDEREQVARDIEAAMGSSDGGYEDGLWSAAQIARWLA